MRSRKEDTYMKDNKKSRSKRGVAKTIHNIEDNKNLVLQEWGIAEKMHNMEYNKKSCTAGLGSCKENR